MHEIKKVTIRNRAGTQGFEYLKDVQVGVSMVQPQIGQELNPESYILCGGKPGRIERLLLLAC